MEATHSQTAVANPFGIAIDVPFYIAIRISQWHKKIQMLCNMFRKLHKKFRKDMRQFPPPFNLSKSIGTCLRLLLLDTRCQCYVCLHLRSLIGVLVTPAMLSHCAAHGFTQKDHITGCCDQG